METSYVSYIGKKVSKGKGYSLGETSKKPKPFKSGSLINTVNGIINHPVLNIPAFTFNEDDSYVECRRCFIMECK